MNPLLDSLVGLPWGWESKPVGRRTATEDDPLLFAYLYLRHHIRGEETGNEVTFSEVHYEWAELAKRWMDPSTEPQAERHALIAPRSMGKSTWWFLILPLWAAAHGHSTFAAAFADSALQAETHLATFKAELERNERLREDFPDLCAPAIRPRGTTVADNRQMLQTKSGFVFAARGIDSGNLGMKVGQQRPDLIILDDVEPGESNYSAYQVTKRLSTVQDVVLPLNVFARVILVGTVTMTGSLVHQLVESTKDPDGAAAWIRDESFQVHYSLPILRNDDGTERSVWPEKWSMEYFDSIRHSRSYAKNFLNQPMLGTAEYWLGEDFIYGGLETASRRIIAIDPAVTTDKHSDETAIAVVSFSVAERKSCVDEVVGVRLKGAPLRAKVLETLARWPDTQFILFERNQGGDLMAESVLHDMPVPVRTVHTSEKKEYRAERLLNYYRRGVVLHRIRHPHLEQQMMEFPKGIHDDLIDAVGHAVHYFANAKRPSRLVATVR